MTESEIQKLALVYSLQGEIEAHKVSIEAMKTCNKERIINNESLAYIENDFNYVKTLISDIVKSLNNISSGKNCQKIEENITLNSNNFKKGQIFYSKYFKKPITIIHIDANKFIHGIVVGLNETFCWRPNGGFKIRNKEYGNDLVEIEEMATVENSLI